MHVKIEASYNYFIILQVSLKIYLKKILNQE